MTLNDPKTKFTKMVNIIEKHWFKNKIPISQLSEKEQLYSMVIICKELGIHKDIVSHLIQNRSINENLIKIQEYYMENDQTH